MSKYAIWDKQSEVYTPGGAVYTAEQWKNKYGWINNPRAVPVVSGGITNGAFLGELSEMKEMYSRMGCEILPGMTDEEVLAAIEEFENRPPVVDITPSPEERTAAALEFLAMASLPDDAA